MKINVNGIELNYIQEGQGKPLILLHGNGEDYRIFDNLISKLKNDFTIYALDSRNHGNSTKTDDFTYETMVEDVYQFIGKLKLKMPNVIGFSDGAIICILLAIKYNELIGKIALLGINLQPTDFKKKSYSDIIREYEATKSPLIAMMLEQPRIALESLRTLSNPALIIAGEKDVFYRKTFQNIARTMPNAALKIMQGHDHSSYIINEALLYPDFFDFFK